MFTRTLVDLLEGWVQDVPALTMTGISSNIRTIKAGEAFVAVQGQLNHGLDFAESAVDAGAVAVIHDGLKSLPSLDVPFIKVNRLDQKLAELASRFYSAPSELMSIAAVTGTNGKAPVAHFLAQSWHRAYGNAGLLGSYAYGAVSDLQNNERASKDAFHVQKVLSDCLDQDVEHLAMEVSSRELEEKVIETVQIDAAVFTDLGNDTSGRYESRADYAAAKRSLFSEYAPAFAIINCDDSYGRQWFGELNGGMEILSFGLGKGSELSAEIRSADRNGMVLRIIGPWGAEDVRTGLLGESNASSLLATAGTLVLLGMPWHRVLNQIELMKPVPGRIMRSRGQAVHTKDTTGKTRVADKLEDAA